MFKHDCKIHGHRFEARYSEKDSGRTLRNAEGYSAEEIRNLTILKVYEYDICTKCGKIIKNKE